MSVVTAALPPDEDVVLVVVDGAVVDDVDGVGVDDGTWLTPTWPSLTWTAPRWTALSWTAPSWTKSMRTKSTWTTTAR